MSDQEVIYGYDAIGRFLNMTAAQARHRLQGSTAPIFKVGRKVAARPEALRQWLDELAASNRLASSAS